MSEQTQVDRTKDDICYFCKLPKLVKYHECFAALMDHKESQSAELSALRKENERLNDGELSHAFAVANGEIAALKAKLADSQSVGAGLVKLVDDLQGQCHDLKAKVSELERERDEWKRMINSQMMLAEMRHPAAPESEMRNGCEWGEDAGEGTWNTGCGEKFYFETDGPAENGFKFCCYCSKPLVDVTSPQIRSPAAAPGDEKPRGTQP